MNKVITVIIALFFSLATANGQEENSKASLGVAFSGPVLGVALTAALSDKYSARVIYSSTNHFQAQLHIDRKPANNTQYIFGVGQLERDFYMRGAFGKKWVHGAWAIGGDIGLNVPITDNNNSSQGLSEFLTYIAVLGIGVHYEFR